MKKLGLCIAILFMGFCISACEKDDNTGGGNHTGEKLPEEIVNEAIASIALPQAVTENIILETKKGDVDISWKSSNIYSINTSGIVFRSGTDKQVTLTATFQYQGFEKMNQYEIIVKGYTNVEKLDMILDGIALPETVVSDITLLTNFEYNITGVWTSDKPDIISNTGKVRLTAVEEQVALTVVLTLGEDSVEKTIIVTTVISETTAKDHQLVYRAPQFEQEKMTNLELVNGKMVLMNEKLEGSFESKPISTMKFTSLVGSWAALSSKHATVELMIKVQVNGVWSEYITYRPWGLGLQNAGVDQSNAFIKLSTDEVIVQNQKQGEAIQYKLILRRTSANDASPQLSLVSFALSQAGYTYGVDISHLPNEIRYDVPKLNQNIVPEIGNSICSATSTTMLLKYKGLSFIDQDSTYEHRYIASIVRDYGNQIYGNWVYNTAAMGGYGFDAYVARMYSVNELIAHLATVGPVAMSVKGTMTSSEGSYNTNGHLIVAIGYKYMQGVLYILCNDPNLRNVYCEYPISVINNTWRQITYIIE